MLCEGKSWTDMQQYLSENVVLKNGCLPVRVSLWLLRFMFSIFYVQSQRLP